MLTLSKDLSFLQLFIINTLVYFDLFDYPLTLNEIHTYLFTGGMEGDNYTLQEIFAELNKNHKLKKIITTSCGFYYLKGRQEIIQTRLERYNIADQKFKITKKAFRLFKYVPFIKLIAVCNNLAYSNANIGSDIDLFVITRKKRIWLVRFVLVSLITLLGLRPPKTKAKDKLCLSFYTTENNLDLSQIKITAEDVYLVFWLATLMPIYVRDGFYNKLIAANPWFKKSFPNWQGLELGYRYRIEDNKFNSFVYKTKEFIYGGFLGDVLDKITKVIQLKKLSQYKKDLAVHQDTRVIINDDMLKFHETDLRLEYLEKFEQKRKEIIDKI